MEKLKQFLKLRSYLRMSESEALVVRVYNPLLGREEYLVSKITEGLHKVDALSDFDLARQDFSFRLISCIGDDGKRMFPPTDKLIKNEILDY